MTTQVFYVNELLKCFVVRELTREKQEVQMSFFFSQRGKEYHCFFTVALLMGIVSIKKQVEF